MNLRESIRETQLLENSAADKAAARFLLIDEKRLLGPDSLAYQTELAEQILKDIAAELVKSAMIGKQMRKEIR